MAFEWVMDTNVFIRREERQANRPFLVGRFTKSLHQRRELATRFILRFRDCIMQIETTVLPGHRVEVTDPQLPEGAKVQVIVMVPEKHERQKLSMLEFLESLPPGPSPRCFPTWEEYERHLREEKDSWER